MKNNETGEFELVLGNRQVLSGFFIVVILFGVFFTMGYIVGRNSAPSPRVAAASEATPDAGNRPETRPQPSSGAAAPPQSTRPPAEAPNASAAEETASDLPAQPTTQPAREPEGAKPTEAADATGPEAGQTYLQVMAVRRPEAEVVMKTLRDKGFSALLGQVPNDTRMRVLVGPFHDMASLGKAKLDLENAGFHAIVQKY